LDEPTEGIQPSIILEIEEAIRRIKKEMGLAVLLVEQYLDFAERLADAYVIMAKGSVVAAGATRDLHADQVKQPLAVLSSEVIRCSERRGIRLRCSSYTPTILTAASS